MTSCLVDRLPRSAHTPFDRTLNIFPLSIA